MGAARYWIGKPEERENGPWAKVEELRSALSSPECAAMFKGQVKPAREASTIDVIEGLRAAFDMAVTGPPNFLESDYEVVRDAVSEWLNPPDGDGAECQVVADAVQEAAEFIQDQPCHCTPEMVEDHDPCKRCRVLGRLGDKPVTR